MPPFDPDALLDPEFHATGDPHRLWSEMRQTNPVWRHQHPNYAGVVSLTRYSDIRAVYTNPQVFSSRFGAVLQKNEHPEDPGGGLTLALTDPPHHRAIRQVIAPFFSGSAVRDMTGFVRSRLTALFMLAGSKDTVNFTDDICARLTLENTAGIIGIPASDHAILLEWLLSAFDQGVSILRNKKCYMYLLDFIHTRRQTPTRDMASNLVTHVTRNGTPLFSDLEILLNIENILGATENAGLTLAAVASALLDHPEQLASFRTRQDPIQPLVHELLRWTSSACHSMRTVVQDTNLMGHPLRVGDRVVLWLPSANRDPATFDDPDHFDLFKKSGNAIALGAGPHACIGGLLARVQIETLVALMLDGPFSIERTGPETALRSITVRGPKLMPVRIRQRASSSSCLSKTLLDFSEETPWKPFPLTPVSSPSS